MRIIIASDIHGSATYCRALVNVFEKSHADKLVLLGDILYHGPRNELPGGYAPKDVITMLNSISGKILCVRGNCEAEVDQMVLDFPVMAEYALIPVEDRMMFVTHGHNFNEEKVPPMAEGDILLNGHTHIPAVREHEHYIYMNPGSTSIPKEDSCNSFMLLDGGNFRWYSLEDAIDADGIEEIEPYMEYTL